MGLYENPAAIECIRIKTKISKIINLGFLLSTTSGLVSAGLRPHSIEIMIDLTPVIFLKTINSAFKYFIPYFCFMKIKRKLMGKY
ncbi:hypothetical protein BDFB_014546, partial [Asbolus verrucosus]